MLQWWNALTLLEQILAYIAIPATVILILQTVMLLFGLGHDSDVDTDTDSDFDDASFDHDHDHDSGTDGLRLFTVRGLVAFFAVGGWLGLTVSRSGAGGILSVAAAFVGGTAALLLVALFFKWALSLQSDGSIDTASAVGTIGEVYIRVPANRGGKGKIMLVIGGALTELDAVTDDDRDIMPREQVKVESTEGSTLVVASVK